VYNPILVYREIRSHADLFHQNRQGQPGRKKTEKRLDILEVDSFHVPTSVPADVRIRAAVVTQESVCIIMAISSEIVENIN
jgi:hypothetical protein